MRFFRQAVLTLTLIALVSCQQRDLTPEVNLFEKGQFPSTLAPWGVLSLEEGQLVPHPESLPYDLVTPLFTDYAHKFRTLWLPAGRAASIGADGELELPLGSVVTKTFYYPRDPNGQLKRVRDEKLDFGRKGLDLSKVKLIETRLLVHLKDGWIGLPYVWNDAGTSATLQITGAIKPLVLNDGAEKLAFDYVVPDFNQCQGCHIENLTTGKMGLIGLKLRHLAKPYRHLVATEDQLDRMFNRGWLTVKPVQQLVNVDWQDDAFSLDDRARSYLDINCGHCHNPAGAGDTSGLFLHRGEMNPLRIGVCKPPVAAGQGTGGRAVGIRPGAARDSILSYRMASLDPGAMMPELGRSTVHLEGVNLIDAWINQMSGECQVAGDIVSSVDFLMSTENKMPTSKSNHIGIASNN